MVLVAGEPENSVSRSGAFRYRILERIGTGGMGVVFRAEDTSLGRQVALKILPAELASRAETVARFEREARAAAALNHPAICTIYEVGRIRGDEARVFDGAGEPVPSGAHFIAMEYIRGKTLRALLGGRSLPVGDALRIGADILAGLAHAHEEGVIHRDLKPANVMISSDGRTKLLDFGLAKFVREAASAPASSPSDVETASGDLTREGVLLGTVRYMSPEQALGSKADHRSDIFSFGVVLHEMLTGRWPFAGDTPTGILASLLRDEPAPASRTNPEVSPDLDRILAKCLEKDPSHRYQSAGDLAADLRRLDGAAEAIAPRRRGSLPVWALASSIAALLILAVVLVARGRDAPVHPVGMAILPLAYEGPPEKAYLKDVVPLLLMTGIEAPSSIQVAPFASSRSFQPSADPLSVARQLGVTWVVSGTLSVDGARFRQSLRAVDPAKPGAGWSKDLEGELSALVQLSAASAADLARTLDPGATAAPVGASSATEAYVRGVTLLEGWDIQKNAVEAEKAFHEAIDEDPSFAAAHAQLAIALLSRFARTKDASLIGRASEAAERAVALAPTLPEAHAALGLVELQKGRSAEAAERFERALGMAPANDALHRRVARAYADLGRDREADAMYRRAVELRPGFWANYQAWGNHCLKRGALERAAELYEKVIELHPDSDSGFTNLAAVYILLGRHADAEPLLLAALKIHPSVQNRNNLGTVYYALGRFEEAAREWEEAASLAKDAMIYSNLGDAYRQLRRAVAAAEAYGKSIDLATSSLERDPTDAETRGMMANALAGSGRCADAAREAMRATSGKDVNPAVAYYASVASAICSDRDATVSYAVRAIRGGVVADVQTNPDLVPFLRDPAVVAALKERRLPARP